MLYIVILVLSIMYLVGYEVAKPLAIVGIITFISAFIVDVSKIIKERKGE